ncbi:MAG: hypothetical protein ACXVED_20490, partial [Bacteroidia bacterium]
LTDKGKGGSIFLTIKKIGGIVECTVEDNGIGRKAAEARKAEERISYGSKIAERLIMIWNENEGRTTFNTIDLVDAMGKATGTRVEFTFPYITFE